MNIDRQLRTLLYCIVAAVILSACEGAIGPGGVTASIITQKPSITRRNTPTPSQTLPPTITPTSTRIPDLEIFNDIIIENTKPTTGTVFFGKIRNNTDTTMILPARENAFIFNFERYQLYGEKFSHDILGPFGLKPGVYGKDGPNSNCILYPHEEGAIFFTLFRSLEQLPGFVSNREEIESYDGPLGFTYTYSGTYTSAPELPSKYHPKPENVTYEIKNGNIYFEYDINVPAPMDKEHEKGMVLGFLIMYDSDGKIVNVLFTDIRSYLPLPNRYDHIVHMHGQSPDGDVPEHWQWYILLTEDQLKVIDHIELLFEVQYEGICFDKRYPNEK